MDLRQYRERAETQICICSCDYHPPLPRRACQMSLWHLFPSVMAVAQAARQGCCDTGSSSSGGGRWPKIICSEGAGVGTARQSGGPRRVWQSKAGGNASSIWTVRLLQPSLLQLIHLRDSNVSAIGKQSWADRHAKSWANRQTARSYPILPEHALTSQL